MWFLVFIFFHGISFVMTCTRICGWLCARDPHAIEAAVSLVYVLILAVPELGWTVVGFVIMKGAGECKETASSI